MPNNQPNATLYVQGIECLPPHIQDVIVDMGLQVSQLKPDFPYLFFDECLQLVQPNTRIKPIFVDFLAGKSQHRRLYGGGKNQLLCKAVGLNKGVKPSVLDMTAGLGGDAFVLASLGCKVHMQERSPFAAALLADGLWRLQQGDIELGQYLSLTFSDSRSSDFDDDFDVVYVDPMYPEHKQKAAVNKSMEAFRHLVGKDEDAADLFERAVKAARCRIAVKRPKSGAYLAAQKPSYQLLGKSSRYDIYAFKALV